MKDDVLERLNLTQSSLDKAKTEVPFVEDLHRGISRYLASVFLRESGIYEGKITIDEVVKAYRCKVKSRGFECPDGWNPQEHRAILHEFNGVEVRRSGTHILWSVVASSFEDWLDHLFKSMGE